MDFALADMGTELGAGNDFHAQTYSGRGGLRNTFDRIVVG